MNHVIVRSLVLLVVSTVIVLVAAFALPPAAPAITPVASQEGMAGHEMAGMDTAPESEAAFISGMIPHHKEAVESARAILETTEKPEVRELAQTVISTQTTEIATLTGWLKRWYPEAAEADYAPMMEDTSGSSPAEADRAFLTGMIGHHEGAIEMARAYLGADYAKHPEVIQLAEAIVAVQDGEIAQMQGWLKAWYGEAGAGVWRTEDDVRIASDMAKGGARGLLEPYTRGETTAITSYPRKDTVISFHL